MEEEDALTDAPERSGSELVGAGAALRDSVGKAVAHVVDDKVRVKICRLIRKRDTRAGRGATRDLCPRGQRGRMAMHTTDLSKRSASFLIGGRGGAGGGGGRAGHEAGKGFH